MMQLNSRNVVLILRSSNYISKYISSPVTCIALYSAKYCAKSLAVVREALIREGKHFCNCDCFGEAAKWIVVVFLIFFYLFIYFFLQVAVTKL